jgi:ATP-binding cassette subfamily F protein 3
LLRNTVDEFLLVDSGQAQPFDGSLEDYRHWLLNRDKNVPSENETASSSSAPLVDKKQARQQAAARRAQLAPLTSKLKKLEQAMKKLAEQSTRIEEQLADPDLYDDSNKEKLKKLLNEQATLREQNDVTEEQWLTIQEELDALEAES